MALGDFLLATLVEGEPSSSLLSIVARSALILDRGVNGSADAPPIEAGEEALEEAIVCGSRL